MSIEAYLKSKEYWQRLGWGLLVGFLSAVGALIFIMIMNFGISLLWSDPRPPTPFSGSWRIVAIMTGAGFLVGLLHKFLHAEEANVFAALVKGRLDPRPVPGALLISLISLVSGFSIGPEVPSGMLAGGLGTWLSERRNLSDETKRTNVLSGVMAAYGGLFTAPFAMMLIPIEMAHRQTLAYFGTIFIAGLSAVIGFAIFFTDAGQEFASTLRLLDLPGYDLQTWHLVAALGLGILGACVAAIFALTMKLFKRLAAPLVHRPIILSTLGGVLLGLLGMALPLTLGLGTEGLVIITQNAQQIGATLLIVLALAKIVALAGALNSGFIGGPIFPLFFVGGAVGSAVSLIFPAIPPALAVGAVMAAVVSAGLPVTFSMSIIVMLIVGLPATEMVPVFLAGLVALVTTHGLGLVKQGPPPKASNGAVESTAGSKA